MLPNPQSKQKLGQTVSEEHGGNEVTTLPLTQVDPNSAAPTRAFSPPHLEASKNESIALEFSRLGPEYEDLNTLLVTLYTEYNTIDWAIQDPHN